MTRWTATAKWLWRRLVPGRAALAILALGAVVFATPALAAPTVWFGAEPPVPLNSPTPTSGSLDYANFLTRPEGWEQAARYIDVVKVNAAWIEKVATKDQLRATVLNLRSHGIGLGLELDALPATATCNGQGFANRDRAEAIRDVMAAGGRVDYVALNEPYTMATFFNKCHIPPTAAAAQIRSFVSEIEQLQPQARIGLVEALQVNIVGQDLVSWVDAYTNVVGRKPDFFDLDVDYAGRAGDWVREFYSIAIAMHRRNISFGDQAFGDRADRTDQDWLTKTYMRAEALARANVPVDTVLFQSWHPRPKYILPESQPGTFMNMVLAYCRRHGIRPH